MKKSGSKKKRAKSGKGKARKSPKRVAAGKKAARTRKARARFKVKRKGYAAEARKPKRKKARKHKGPPRNYRKKTVFTVSEEAKKPKRKKSKRKAPCTPKIAQKRADSRKTAAARKLAKLEKKAMKQGVRYRSQIERLQRQASEARRKHRKPRKHKKHATHHARKHHHVRAMNPIKGWGEGLAAVGGLLIGALSTVLGDRFAAGHALQGDTTKGLVDQPGAGELYNANGSLAPIWSNWKRMVWAGANLVVPFGSSMVLKRHEKTQTFFQTWFVASFATILGKATLDVLPKVLGKRAIGARLLAPEIDAQNSRASVKASNIPLPGYTLVAGGTGPAPVAPAAGGTMLGAPGAAPGGGGATAGGGDGGGGGQPTPMPPQPTGDGGGTLPGPVPPAPPPLPHDETTHPSGCQCSKCCEEPWDRFSQVRNANQDVAAQ